MAVYDFQEVTAERIAAIFRDAIIDGEGRERMAGGQRRVLLADEVGLGKTIVAWRGHLACPRDAPAVGR